MSKRWGFILYPESTDIDSFIKKATGCDDRYPIILSPLHDSDVDDLGNLKKPHYHCILLTEHRIGYSTALNILADFGASVSTVQAINIFSSYCRYMIHMDNPEKAQYDPDEVLCLNGARADFTEFKQKDIYTRNVRSDIIKLIQSGDISSIGQLCWYYIDDPYAIDYIESKTYFLQTLITFRPNN